jgi:proteasome lid subunit RPN8/RPN11
MLRIADEKLALVRAHAQETYPGECCGVLIGTFADQDRNVRQVVACTNEITGRQDRFSIPAAELIAAQKQARTAGLEIVGFYHSHPDHPPIWSATDLAEAHWFGCSYLIVSVAKGMAAEARSFVLRGDESSKHFEEEAIEPG